MTDIPPEIKEILDSKELQKPVEQQPGTLRFKAMVLGLSAFQYIKGQEKGDLEPDVDSK